MNDTKKMYKQFRVYTLMSMAEKLGRALGMILMMKENEVNDLGQCLEDIEEEIESVSIALLTADVFVVEGSQLGLPDEERVD